VVVGGSQAHNGLHCGVCNDFVVVSHKLAGSRNTLLDESTHLLILVDQQIANIANMDERKSGRNIAK